MNKKNTMKFIVLQYSPEVTKKMREGVLSALCDVWTAKVTQVADTLNFHFICFQVDLHLHPKDGTL